MNILTCHIPGLLIIEPKVFGDARGFFFESFNARKFSEQAGVTLDFVQDNHSRSVRHVLRGLHSQIRLSHGKRLADCEVFETL